ncbi:hypothetical protein [Pseudoduganella sp. R-43]|uniref:hypothetical protein n=1 Tax=unclassified Pseudoduganella TaxID=2637179 RepID=UPI003CF08D72
MRYRYIISTSAAGRDGDIALNVTIQAESGSGCILKIAGLSTRDPWLDFPQPESADKYLKLRPRHVASLIKHALANGWSAQQAGAPFQMNANECAFMPEYG